MAKLEIRHYQEKTILLVLYQIRAQIIREQIDGPDQIDGLLLLSHVDALLRARGADPAAFEIPQTHRRRFRRNGLRAAVLAALRDGPLTTAQVAAAVGDHRGGRSVGEALRRLRTHGTVRVVRVDRAGRYVSGIA